jgi:hypothetical protein
VYRRERAGVSRPAKPPRVAAHCDSPPKVAGDCSSGSLESVICRHPRPVVHRLCHGAGSERARMGSFTRADVVLGKALHARTPRTCAHPRGPRPGCSDDPEPTPNIPDPTTSSPTPTEPATEEPEAESPEEFIRRWVEVGDEMQVTGETAEYERMVDESCDACASFVNSVRDVYSSGGSVEFEGARINGIRERDPSPPTFAVTKTLPRTVIRRGGNSTPETLPAGRTTLLVILKDRRRGWVVSYFGIL